MMEPGVIPELEELTLCSFCKQKFNDTDLCPKLLSCKHYFCLNCIQTALMKGRELYCVHCWKRTELGEQGADSLQTYSAVLTLAKNFTSLKIGPGGSGGAAVVGGNKPPDKDRKVVPSENCHTHGMPLALWCHTCCAAICRACATQQDHPGHQVKSQGEAKDQLVSEVHNELVAMNKMLGEIQRLAMQQRDFLLKVLEACVTLKTHVETDLQNGWSHVPEVAEARETLSKARAGLAGVDGPGDAHVLYSSLSLEKQRLQGKYQEMYLQCQLDDLIGNSAVVFDFGLLKQALANIHSGEPPMPAAVQGRIPHVAAAQNPILFLANYCMSQLYSRHVLTKQQHHHLQQNGTVDYHHPPVHPIPHHLVNAPHPPPPQHVIVAPPPTPVGNKPPQALPSVHHSQPPPQTPYAQEPGVVAVPVQSPPQNVVQLNVRGPSGPYPLYYFNIDVNGSPHGRIVIEVRPDAAPKMAKNFGVLCTGEMGVSYKGCAVFQCWEGESVITGDFELNNGRGGRSIFEDGYFMPDDTKFPAVRGAVGMRRTQKRHDNLGMVGSQFRIILQEMRGFTGIFGHVVEGLELVEKISTFGDQAGKPTKTIVITKCGKL
ncbi:hypothetical protein R5R35_011201 [Gryllus longicercus]|uniref:Uncharacterized protein n=2 Tax=Gryllus longicercus TaxID=2509291 RepID=A0AAN9VUP8_9ORTH|nr:Uncharacterized protein GBIM_01495 [Gryllus bimaculatus]